MNEFIDLITNCTIQQLVGYYCLLVMITSLICRLFGK